MKNQYWSEYGMMAMNQERAAMAAASKELMAMAKAQLEKDKKDMEEVAKMGQPSMGGMGGGAAGASGGASTFGVDATSGMAAFA